MVIGRFLVKIVGGRRPEVSDFIATLVVICDGEVRPFKSILCFPMIRAAGFADVEREAFRIPGGLVAPHVAGVATV